ncbi:MAG TPA: tagaturonate epimerase family protein [Ktedonobacterales bacterium]|nr:tagaturonate epimerase family protein [Ktedonobacterales bacterium]
MPEDEQLVSPPLRERLRLITQSVTESDDLAFAMSALDPTKPQVAIIAKDVHAIGSDFIGDISVAEDRAVLLGPCAEGNATTLRQRLPWLRAQPLGLSLSAGFGDRLGLATPGHLRALRQVGGSIAPILAQQSIREMGRTGRTPQQVMDDAMWGVFGEGWRSGFGADADHLKTTDDIDQCVTAGYTFYTFDPSAHVDNTADSASPQDLQDRFEALPWKQLADTPNDLVKRYLDSTLDCDGYPIAFDEVALRRAAVKYGRALAHVSALYQHLVQVSDNRSWEVEVSVDETETPTTHAEHVYWARELSRLEVRWVSLAPRFVGAFEKGVDYIGDLAAFAKDFAVHAAIARSLGPYKLSLHSGSDKFSIYDICAEEARGRVHLKTAGTSYLEALRAIGVLEPSLLREIYAFACDHYAVDRASYHVSARLDRAQDPAQPGYDVAALLDQFDARQILHVTFGSVLTARTAQGAFLFRDRIMALLRSNPEVYAEILTSHSVRHLRPFAAMSHGQDSDTRQ